MDAETICKVYVRYIGAGAVAAGGIISLCRALPLIVASIASGLRDMRGGIARRRRHVAAPIATCRWPPSSSVRWLLVLAIWVFLGLDPQAGGGCRSAAMFNGTGLVNLVAAVLIVLFGFLFVTVSSRLTGEIGSSSNPISGMTIATLLLTCLIFLMLGWTGAALPPAGAFRGGGGVHRVVQRRHHLAGPQDGLPRRRHAQVAAVGHPRRVGVLGPGDRRGVAWR